MTQKKPLIEQIYTDRGLRLLMAAVVRDAAERAEIVNKKTDMAQAVQAARWLEEYGEEWLEAAAPGVDRRAFRNWIKETRARLDFTGSIMRGMDEIKHDAITAINSELDKGKEIEVWTQSTLLSFAQ